MLTAQDVDKILTRMDNQQLFFDNIAYRPITVAGLGAAACIDHQGRQTDSWGGAWGPETFILKFEETDDRLFEVEWEVDSWGGDHRVYVYEVEHYEEKIIRSKYRRV